MRVNLGSDKSITGGCACGSFRYEFKPPILSAFHCHCRHCQYSSGAGHSSLFVVSSYTLQTEGNLKLFDQEAESGNIVSRGFCPYCGTPVTCITSGNEGVVMLHAASLDNPEHFNPTKSVFEDRKCSWDFAIE